ncbi:MAG TPA: hypothetical protein VLR26_11965 [Frankiaceae bacterium]|nr:hypothetical protein [Frankiaceae bacterium]
MRNLQVWYHSLDAAQIETLTRGQLAKRGRRRLSRTVAQARNRDNLDAFEKVTRWWTGSAGSSPTRLCSYR